MFYTKYFFIKFDSKYLQIELTCNKCFLKIFFRAHITYGIRKSSHFLELKMTYDFCQGDIVLRKTKNLQGIITGKKGYTEARKSRRRGGKKKQSLTGERFFLPGAFFMQSLSKLRNPISQTEILMFLKICTKT